MKTDLHLHPHQIVRQRSVEDELPRHLNWPMPIEFTWHDKDGNTCKTCKLNIILYSHLSRTINTSCNSITQHKCYHINTILMYRWINNNIKLQRTTMITAKECIKCCKAQKVTRVLPRHQPKLVSRATAETNLQTTSILITIIIKKILL